MLMKLTRCKIERKKQIELMKLFIAEVTARTAGELVGVNRRTAILFYHKLREIIAVNLEVENQEYFAGEIEVDESYFGGVSYSSNNSTEAHLTKIRNNLSRHNPNSFFSETEIKKYVERNF